MTVEETLISLVIACAAAYVIWLGLWLIDNRKRYRVTCECGHREKAYTLTSAKWAGTEHMQVCKGHTVVSPLPPAEIAKAAEQ